MALRSTGMHSRLYIRACRRLYKTHIVPFTWGDRTLHFPVSVSPSLATQASASCVADVPAHALAILRDAYGNRVGQTGWDLEGHLADGDVEKHANLTYGEMLPGGAAKAFRRLGLTTGVPCESMSLLELGMGTGMLALQAFAQCSRVSRVIGIEVSEPRFCLAVRALRQLADARPHQFRLSEITEHEGPSVEGNRCIVQEVDERAGKVRLLDIRLGDFLSPETLTDEELESADAIMMQVVLPHDILPRVHDRLSLASHGCRLFSLSPLSDGGRPEHFRRCRHGDRSEEDTFTDRYAASWGSSDGVVFHTFRATIA